MSLHLNKNENENENGKREEKFSLNDDRRVKVLSPGTLVAKRFFRNRLAVTGLIILIFMFVFSFIGGLISPYGQDQFFYTNNTIRREFGAVKLNKEYRFAAKDAEKFSAVIQAQAMLAMTKKETSFTYRDVGYTLENAGEDFWKISLDGELIGIAFKDIVSASSGDDSALSFDFIESAMTANLSGASSFEADGESYTIDADRVIYKADGTETAFISRYIVNAVMPDIKLKRNFKEQIIDAIEGGNTTFSYTDESLIITEPETEEVTGEAAPAGDAPAAAPGETTAILDDDELPEPDIEISATAEYDIEFDPARDYWKILQEQTSYQYDKYSFPSSQHLLGTDGYGMDMLTRLMYGGRVSLLIGFIVIAIETVLGVIMGGIAGYFGGWVDNLIMRLVDIFYCIPSTPILIIIGAAMDKERVDPTLRMVYLMLILGVLGWAGVARLVRGQILSLREQEFMTATEACGIKVSSRIFRHLIPNVIPQLIVNCTMGLGSVIIMEATLSFLGLGVRFPFASWGNIISDVNNTYVLTTYWFIWIPAGVLLLLTVLAFNIVGDGLRDAFDPKMKR